MGPGYTVSYSPRTDFTLEDKKVLQSFISKLELNLRRAFKFGGGLYGAQIRPEDRLIRIRYRDIFLKIRFFKFFLDTNVQLSV